MNWLHSIGLAGLVLSLLVFILYIFSVLPSVTGPEESSASWSLKTGEYLEATGLETGAMWMFRAVDGYGLSTSALAILATTALPTLLALAVVWLRRRDWLYGAMALAVSTVLIVAIVS